MKIFLELNPACGYTTPQRKGNGDGMTEQDLLDAIGSTEPSSFNEFLHALGDEAPEREDKTGWRKLFKAIEKAAEDGLIEVSRAGTKIDSLILTEAGIARVRHR